MNPPFFRSEIFEGIPVILSDGFQVPFDAWTELNFVFPVWICLKGQDDDS